MAENLSSGSSIKSKEENKNADKKPTFSKKEFFKNFLFRKLKVFSKFIQSELLVFPPLKSPVRCTACHEPSFFLVDISFYNDHEDEEFKFRNICQKCVLECHVACLTAKQVNFIAKYVSSQDVSKLLHSTQPEQELCDCCTSPDNVRFYWVKFKKMPLKLKICDNCISIKLKTSLTNVETKIASDVIVKVTQTDELELINKSDIEFDEWSNKFGDDLK